MSSPGFEFGEFSEPHGFPRSSPSFFIPRPERWWLHALLLVLTLLTTSFMGARLADDFERNLPAFQDDAVSAAIRVWEHPALLATGLPFSLTLLIILMAHELGHYFACLYYGIDASPPYFLPAPTLMGTFGAFIRLRSPTYTRRALFDVGVAGPLAGFLFLVPAMAIGVAYGKVLPGIAVSGDYVFGVPLIERFLHWVIFPAAAHADIYLHPIGRAAWVGVLATALNLLPIGQLDGGHLTYAFFGERCRLWWKLGVAVLIPMGVWVSSSWLFWAAFLAIFALRHPRLYDEEPMGAGRVQLLLLSLVVLIVCFTPIPVDVAQ